MKIFSKIFLAIVIISTGYGGYCLYQFLTLGRPNQTQFQQEIWLTHNKLDELDNPRGGMIDDLFENHLTNGLKRNQVIKFLGEPYDEIVRIVLKNGEADSLENRYDKEARAFRAELKRKFGDPDTLMLYPIGWHSGFGIDPDFLVLRMSGDSLVTKFWKEQG